MSGARGSGKLPRVIKAKASVFRRWLVTRAYSPHPEPPVLRVEAIFGLAKINERRLLVNRADGKIMF